LRPRPVSKTKHNGLDLGLEGLVSFSITRVYLSDPVVDICSVAVDVANSISQSVINFTVFKVLKSLWDPLVVGGNNLKVIDRRRGLPRRSRGWRPQNAAFRSAWSPSRSRRRVAWSSAETPTIPGSGGGCAPAAGPPGGRDCKRSSGAKSATQTRTTTASPASSLPLTRPSLLHASTSSNSALHPSVIAQNGVPA